MNFLQEPENIVYEFRDNRGNNNLDPCLVFQSIRENVVPCEQAFLNC